MYKNKHRSAQPNNLIEHKNQNIIRIVTNKPKTSDSDIAKELGKYKPIHIQTVRNILRSNYFHSPIRRRKPFIIYINMIKCRELQNSTKITI